MDELESSQDSPSPISSTSSSLSESYLLLHEKLRVNRIPNRLKASRPLLYAICALLLLVNTIWYFSLRSHPSEALLSNNAADWPNNNGSTAIFRKPEHFRVVAHVMYHSRTRTSILECYLQGNLVAQGGFIDQVVFFYETGQEEDKDWLEALVASNSAYYISKDSRNGNGHVLAWEKARAGTMYIHMSSEVVFLEEGTVPSLIKTRLESPEPFAISANIVNQPVFSWIHHHLGVVLPYRPELKPSARTTNTSGSARFVWRASDLPTWNGADDSDASVMQLGVPTDFKPPFRGHRWLPMKSSDPISSPLPHEVLDSNGPGKWSWTVGAQHHYSFLDHLERRDLNRYKIPTWDFQYEPFKPSILCLWGQDIVENKPMASSDASLFSKTIPQRTGRYVVADGRALAVHFADRESQKDMAMTDLLDRYEAYAEENVCR
ncbi:MAG: hypothetical protein Q9160_006114 [Pyrenula sp. 1 TL-2023]